MMEMVNCALLLSESVLCTIAAVYFVLIKGYTQRKGIWMIAAQLSMAAALFSDALTYIFGGQPGLVGYWGVRISNFLVFFMLELLLFFFVHYVGICLFCEGEPRPRRFYIAQLFSLLGMMLVVVSQFTGLYYTFDAQNVYHRAAGYPVSVAVPVIIMLLVESLLIQYRQRIGGRLFLATSIYIILPLIGSGLQLMIYGPAITNLLSGASMILLFMTVLAEQNGNLHQAEEQRIKLAEKLEIANMLNRCVAKLTNGTNRDQALNDLLEIIRDYFQADRSYLFEIKPEKQILVNTYEAVREGVRPEIDNLQDVPIEVISHWMDRFRQERVYYMESLEQEKGFPSYEILAAQDVRSLLEVPLWRNDEIIGMLGLDNPHQHEQDPTLLSSIRFFITESLEQRDQQKHLWELSYCDHLTHLHNRNGYMETLRTWQETAPKQVGGIFVDLNGLKKTNDTFGHKAGDALLCRLADVLETVFPGEGCRIGGDEFVVLLKEIPEAEFKAKVRQLREELVHRNVSAAVGAVWEEAPEQLENLMREADDEMYREKQKMKQ